MALTSSANLHSTIPHTTAPRATTLPTGTYQSSQQREAKQSLVAWSVSLLIHLILIAALLTATWSSGLRPEAGQSPVRVIVEGEASLDSPGEVMTSPSPQLAAPVPMKFSGQTTLSDLPSQSEASEAMLVEPLVGLDLAAGMGESTDGDAWSQLAVGGGAAHGAAEFFGLRATGGKFIFVIDKSGSMKGDRLDAAKQELFRSVVRLGEKMTFLIIFYDETFVPMPVRELVPASRFNKRDALSWVGSIRGDGGTRPLEAMQFALSLGPDAVWLLSDGEFNESYAEDIRRANPEGETVIHTIAFHSQGGEQVLKRIAQENGGQYRFISPP